MKAVRIRNKIFGDDEDGTARKSVRKVLNMQPMDIKRVLIIEAKKEEQL